MQVLRRRSRWTRLKDAAHVESGWVLPLPTVAAALLASAFVSALRRRLTS